MLPLVFLVACGDPDPKDTAAPDVADDTAIDTADTGDETGTTDSSDTGDDTGGDTGETGDTAETGETGETGDTGDTGDTGGPTPPAVILFIGDGMGFAHVEGGGLYAYGAAGTLTMEALPYAGRLRTASLDGTTDSAAAATALASGTKTLNGVVGMDEDGMDLTSIVEDARALGLSAGVVTTDELTGATPASFFAHVENRMDDDGIAADLFADPPDVVLGGGYTDVDDYLGDASLNVVLDETDLLAASDDGRPLVGAFANGTFPWVADGYTDEPALAVMVERALRFLEDDPDGFILVVEGARIDHASHGMDGDRVHHETAAFDEAIAAAVGWAGSRSNTTLLVTADHECGGLTVSGGGSVGVIPDSDWRWGLHTNADVPVFGMGTLAAAIDGQRLDNTWVHAILDAAVRGDASVTPPAEIPVVDGFLDDLGPAVTTQTWSTSFGASYNQLDGLRVASDTVGLRIGVDGVFERGANTVVALLDLDYGAATGLGADVDALLDTNGQLDSLLGRIPYDAGLSGLGFDAAVGSIGAEEVIRGDMNDSTGLRGFYGDFGAIDDLWWMENITAYDDGNVADQVAAADAGATGATQHGMEILVPWDSLYTAGLPAGGTAIGLVVVLVDGDGDYASNQALPPLSSATEPGEAGATIASIVTLEVDATGNIVVAPAVTP